MGDSAGKLVDYYALLGLEQSADMEIVRKRIAERIRELQPAANTRKQATRETAEKRLAVLLEARRFLLDRDKRQEYDKSLRAARVRRPSEAAVTLHSDASVRTPKGSELDVLLLFDTTGSMYRFLEAVRRGLARIVKDVQAEIPGVRFGVVAFGDHGDAYVTKVRDFSSDFAQIRSFIEGVEATGGGDFPEALEDALHEAGQCQWTESARKALVLVGDAPPHSVDQCPARRDYRSEVEELASRGVTLYTVLCGEKFMAKQVFEWIAHTGKGVCLPLHQMDDLVDLLIGVCMRECGKLAVFEDKLRREGRMTPAREGLVARLKAVPPGKP